MDKLMSESGYSACMDEINILEIAENHILHAVEALIEAKTIHHVDTQDASGLLGNLMTEMNDLLTPLRDQADEWDDGRPYPRMRA